MAHIFNKNIFFTYSTPGLLSWRIKPIASPIPNWSTAISTLLHLQTSSPKASSSPRQQTRSLPRTSVSSCLRRTPKWPQRAPGQPEAASYRDIVLRTFLTLAFNTHCRGSLRPPLRASHGECAPLSGPSCALRGGGFEYQIDEERRAEEMRVCADVYLSKFHRKRWLILGFFGRIWRKFDSFWRRFVDLAGIRRNLG